MFYKHCINKPAGVMKLFSTTRSPFGRKALVMAIEKGLENKIEVINEDLTKKSSALIAGNPLGKVPLLVLENGTAIYDSPVICEYIDSLTSQKLIPQNNDARIKCLTLSALGDGMTESGIAIFYERLKPAPDKNVINKYVDVLKRSVSLLERENLTLDKFTMAEISVASAIGYINFRLPDIKLLEGSSKLANWYNEFSKRPSMQKTIPIG